MTEIILRKDNEWSVIDGDPCRIIKFTPLVSVESGRVVVSNKTAPYASIILECKKLPQQTKGFICHKMDFQHLWTAFKERGVQQDEEVIIFWSKKHFKGFTKIFSAFMPRLWVMIYKKGAFELITNFDSQPELQGEARFLAEKPIIEWKPKVMD
ncbi:MAG: hypothetical protein PHW31_00840 [Candidatus Pacebacteria bacterium]|nr:hypothetical protein [Candidatus Paceibacterota bacterium]